MTGSGLITGRLLDFEYAIDVDDPALRERLELVLAPAEIAEGVVEGDAAAQEPPAKTNVAQIRVSAPVSATSRRRVVRR